MFVVHATEKLRKRLRQPVIADPDTSTTRLGSWYATALMWRPQAALFVNEPTLLPVFLPLAPATTLLDRFPTALAEVLRAHHVGEEFITAEIANMNTSQITKTNNRSILGVMNDLTYLAQHHLNDEPATTLLDLSVSLAGTPFSPLYKTHTSPDRALAAIIAQQG